MLANCLNGPFVMIAGRIARWSCHVLVHSFCQTTGRAGTSGQRWRLLDEAAREDASCSPSIADRPVLVNPRNSIPDIHDVLVSEEGNMFRQQYFSVTPAHPKQVKVRFESRKSGNAQRNTFWISRGDPRAMAPMRNPYLDQPRRSEGNGSHEKSLSGSATEIRGRWCPWEILIWFAATEILGLYCPWEILFTIDYGLDDVGSNEETQVKSRKGNLTMIFAAKICETRHKCNERVVKVEAMQGLSDIIICDSNPGKKIQQRKRRHCRNIFQETKGAG